MSVFVKIFQVYDVDTEADDAVAAADDDVDADSMIAMMNSVQNVYDLLLYILHQPQWLRIDTSIDLLWVT